MGKSFWIGTIIVVIILGITAGIIVHVYGDERTERATLKQANELARMKEAPMKIIRVIKITKTIQTIKITKIIQTIIKITLMRTMILTMTKTMTMMRIV